MIILTPGDFVKAQLQNGCATETVDIVSSWRDITVDTYSAGRFATFISGTAAISVVDSPVASTQRVVDHISIFNKDSAENVITVSQQIAGSAYILWRGNLSSGWSARYIESAGWVKIDAEGDTSDVGADGPVGPPGETIVGPAGSPGVSGLSIQGEKGESGVSGISIQGEKGESGVSGISIQGERGEVGASGISFIWRNIWDVVTSYVANDVVYCSGSSFICLTDVTGTPEPATNPSWYIMTQKGADGSNGFDGAPGVSGISIQGEKGEPGVSGISIQGERGEPGVSGISIQGPAGPAGNPGVSGINGLNGTNATTSPLWDRPHRLRPAVLTTDVNNWTPPGYMEYSYWQIQSTKAGLAAKITGINSSGIPVGRIITMQNIGAANIVFPYNDGGSSLGNRFSLSAATKLLEPNGIITFRYSLNNDTDALYWMNTCGPS